MKSSAPDVPAPARGAGSETLEPEKMQLSRALLEQVLATLPVGVVVTDVAGDVIIRNATAERIWGDVIRSGSERWARSKGWWHHSGERIAPAEWASVRALTQGETSLNELIDVETFTGQTRTIQNSAAPVRTPDGRIVGAVVVNEDVTARVRADATLRQSERIQREAEELGHTGRWEHNLVTGEIVNSEEQLRLFFGPDRTRGSRLDDFVEAIHPEDREYVMRGHEQMLAGGRPDIEYRVVWPDGSVHWIFSRATVVRDESGNAVRTHGTNLDITERKQTEQALRSSADRLQQLSRRLIEVQEAERKHLARELHDEFGQLIATVSLLLHAARGAAGEGARSRLDECAVLLRRAGEQMSSLALELRPTMLETVGLERTLRWLAEQHQVRTGTPTEVVGHVEGVSADVAIACFRAAQEALTNVVRHAQARRVRIEVIQSEGRLDLTVRDDGVGFDVTRSVEYAAPGEHLGLLGMRERVQILGGSVQVVSAPGQGTTICVSIPLAEAAVDMAAATAV